MNEPRITCHRTERFTLTTPTRPPWRELGTSGVFFEWEGPTWRPVAITHDLLGHDADLLQRLPWKLRATGRWDFAMNADWYARADGWRVVTWAMWRLQALAVNAGWRLVWHIYRLAFITGRFAPAPCEHFGWRHFWRGFRLHKIFKGP